MMDNATLIEFLQQAASIVITAAVTWVITRRKNAADISQVYTDTARELVENVRSEMGLLKAEIAEVRAANDSLEIKVNDVQEENKVLAAILRKWAVGIKRLSDQIRDDEKVPCWNPEASDLERIRKD